VMAQTEPWSVRTARELRKLSAFIRRDFLTAWSYRMAFFSDAVGLVIQVIMFYFLGLMVDPGKVPEYGGHQTSYIAFVAVGIVLGAFLTLGLGRVATALRGEQLMGTLESLFMTPTTLLTLQLGLAIYDLVYVPIRTSMFLALVALIFGIPLALSGVAPALVILLLFIPFVWGLGMISGAIVLTYRRGAGMLGLGGMAVNFLSGAYFPLDLLPGWLQSIANANPVALAFDGTRAALLGGAGWEVVASGVWILAAWAAVALAAGSVALRLALRRERRRGTLGRY
jgi:ABC-2 type transport system permease protein